jgi:hypothetical protein
MRVDAPKDRGFADVGAKARLWPVALSRLPRAAGAGNDGSLPHIGHSLIARPQCQEEAVAEPGALAQPLIGASWTRIR